jgi:hypothetical protein
MNPFKVGDQAFLVSQTLYYVGTVEAYEFGWIKLKDASWVHATGRLSDLMRTGVFDPQRARVEPVGDVFVFTANLIAAYPFPFPLPTQAI